MARARARRKRPWSERQRAHDWVKTYHPGIVPELSRGVVQATWTCKKCGAKEYSPRLNRVPDHYMVITCIDGKSRMCDEYIVWKIQEG